MLCQREQQVQGLGVLKEPGLLRTCKEKKNQKKMHLKDFLKYVSITLAREEEKYDVEKARLGAQGPRRDTRVASGTTSYGICLKGRVVPGSRGMRGLGSYLPGEEWDTLHWLPIGPLKHQKLLSVEAGELDG